ncbi:MAG: dicarboxylate/amino acid:cation symporter [Thermonemataceae bacterium]
MKIALHWQIIIALVLATIAGILFPVSYEITEEDIEQAKVTSFEEKEKILPQLSQLKGESFQSSKGFEEKLQTTYPALTKKDQKKLVELAKHTPIDYVSWMGDIFLRALKMIIVPLILSSIISGIANLGNGENLGRLGGKTVLYYLTTSVFAIVTGLVFVNIIQPGVGAPIGNAAEVEGLEEARGSFGDTLLNMIPTNVFDAFTKGDMLSIIFFAILFGFFITKVQEKYSQQLTNFFNATFEVMMQITMFIIKFTALGVFGLVAAIVAEQAGDSAALSAMAASLGKYMVAVVAALGFHFFITLPLLMRFVGKVNPLAHFKNMATPLLTAFSTSSSSATLPLTLTAVEQKSGVSNKITSFTLPLGATINMDGTALYECVAAMFIAQAYGISLSLGEQVIVVMTALLASIGAAGIPMAGLVMISVILTAVGLPLEGIGMVLAVDRVLDMLRTTTNVWSDSCGAVIVAKSEGEDLKV